MHRSTEGFTIFDREKKKMTTEHWGPKKWNELHLVGLDASMNIISKHTFLEHTFNLINEIPCEECRNHYKEILKRIPPTSMDPFEWTVVVHNEVNRRLGKQLWDTKNALNLYKKKSKIQVMFNTSQF